MPITVAVQCFTGCKYPLHLVPVTISHPIFLAFLGLLLSRSLLTTNGGLEMHQAFTFSLYRGKPFTQ
jgi:hypothetical protein